MDERKKVQYAVVKAKANNVKAILDTMDDVHFGISLLIARRELERQQFPCLDGCGHKFSLCPRWRDNPELFQWVKQVLRKIRPPTRPNTCPSCFLPQLDTSDLHSKCDVAPNHYHPWERNEDLYESNLETYGPAIMLLRQQPIMHVMGYCNPSEAITVDEAAEFLSSSPTLPSHGRLQVLLLLEYHLRPTTAHTPALPATSIKLARTHNNVPLPPRQDNNRYLLFMLQEAIQAAVDAVNEIDRFRPVSGYEIRQETYSDNTSAKIRIEWKRTPPRTSVEERDILEARCQAVISALDQISESDARLMLNMIAQELRSVSWECQCGSGAVFRSCMTCRHKGENKLHTIEWIDQILTLLPPQLSGNDRSSGQQCEACLVPTLPTVCDPTTRSLFDTEHQRDSNNCGKNLFHIVGPPMASLLRTSVRRVMGLDIELLRDPSEMATWLANPWPQLPTLSQLHRLSLLHHFLLPTSRYSPLAGFGIAYGKATNHRGFSEVNITYLMELETHILYSSIESVRPVVTSKRIVEITGLDGKTNTSVATDDTKKKSSV